MKIFSALVLVSYSATAMANPEKMGLESVKSYALLDCSTSVVLGSLNSPQVLMGEPKRKLKLTLNVDASKKTLRLIPNLLCQRFFFLEENLWTRGVWL